MFELITLPALLIAGVLILMLAHRWQTEAQARAAAETEAAMAYGKGFRAATDEINAKRDRESTASYDKGFENGWNACVTQFEDVGVPTQARAA
jgi:hypothetical protein